MLFVCFVCSTFSLILQPFNIILAVKSSLALIFNTTVVKCLHNQHKTADSVTYKSEGSKSNEMSKRKLYYLGFAVDIPGVKGFDPQFWVTILQNDNKKIRKKKKTLFILSLV